MSDSEHLPGVQPGGHTRPQVGLPFRPFRPVERPAEQSRKAVSNRRNGAKSRRCLRSWTRSEDAGKVTRATPVARPCVRTSNRQAGTRGDYSAKRKSESRAGRTERRISQVRSIGECVAELWPSRGISRRRRESEQGPPDVQPSKKASPQHSGVKTAASSATAMWKSERGKAFGLRLYIGSTAHWRVVGIVMRMWLLCSLE